MHVGTLTLAVLAAGSAGIVIGSALPDPSRHRVTRAVDPQPHTEEMERARLRVPAGGAIDRLLDVLDRFDPMAVSRGSSRGKYEYEPEARTIAARLGPTPTVGEAQRIVTEELAWWFDGDRVGPAARYRELARALVAARDPGPPMVTAVSARAMRAVRHRP
jgi:hypothetical protein